jgi:hypothetical protein
MSDATVTGDGADVGSGQPDLAWGARIPLLNNRFIWWDFAKIIDISVPGMWVAVLVASLLIDASDPVLLPWQLPVVCGGVIGVCFVIACLVMGNGYSARFLVDSDGVHWDSGSKEKKFNRAVATIGVLAGSAGTAGSGLLAASEESGSIAWNTIRRLNVHPGPRVVSVRNGWRVVVRLYIPAGSWDAVVARLQAGVTSGS